MTPEELNTIKLVLANRELTHCELMSLISALFLRTVNVYFKYKGRHYRLVVEVNGIRPRACFYLNRNNKLVEGVLVRGEGNPVAFRRIWNGKHIKFIKEKKSERVGTIVARSRHFTRRINKDLLKLTAEE